MPWNRWNSTSLPTRRIVWRLILAVFACLAIAPRTFLAQQPERVVKAFGPFQIIGSIYYVGDTGNAVYLFTTSEAAR